MQRYSIRKWLGIPQYKITKVISESGKEVHIPPKAGSEESICLLRVRRSPQNRISWSSRIGGGGLGSV